MSTTLLIGWIFLSTTGDPNQARAGLLWLSDKLSIILDKQTLDDLTTAIAQDSTAAICAVNKRPGCAQAMQAATIIGSLEVERHAKENSGTPVTWLLDEPRPPVSSGLASGFLISGMNVSNATLRDVHGILKPDSTQRELELALNVQSNKLEDKDVIPAGARFSLGLEIPTTNSQNQFGGAVFIFRYVYAEQQTALFWHFTPAMTARLGTRQAAIRIGHRRKE
jgi:hypothetical protein